jgi:hypothetical protein
MRIGINTGNCSGHMWGRAGDVEDSLVALARWLHQSGHKIEIIQNLTTTTVSVQPANSKW